MTKNKCIFTVYGFKYNDRHLMDFGGNLYYITNPKDLLDNGYYLLLSKDDGYRILKYLKI